MKLYYLNSEKLDNFRNKVKDNIDQYRSGKLKFVTAKDLVAVPKIKFEHFELDMSESKPSDTDYENIKRVYLAFKDLEDGQASEERLWAGLCHYSFFWEYLRYRWGCETEKEVLTRYFFDDASRSIFMNGLARLWWYGRMTYDEEAKDPFELTEYICKGNMTLKGLLPVTFSFSSNRKVYKTYLKTLMEFEKKNKLVLDQEDHDMIRRLMGLWGGNLLLDTFSAEELKAKIYSALQRIVSMKKTVKKSYSKDLKKSKS